MQSVCTVVHERTNEGMVRDEGMDGRTNEQTDEQTNEWTDGRKNKRTDGRTN